MAITLPVENTIFLREAVEDLKKKFKREGKREDAAIMLKDGMPLAQVQKYTGLPVAELKQLCRDLEL